MNKYNSCENLIVIIPAYEPPKEFISYAKEVAKIAKALIVVNDGSEEKYDEIFEEIAGIENVKYIKYKENCGKGHALKTAFEFCYKNFNEQDIVLTADCDGQHKIKDVIGVYKSAVNHPNTLCLGSRNFDLPQVPKRSRSGNTKIRALFRIFYGIKLNDTQTGLRAFNVSLIPLFLSVKGDRFEYEMAMLIKAKRSSLRIIESPIETVYPENPEEHVSHFKTCADSIRVVSVLLTNLFFYLLSSTISAVVDVLIFHLLSSVVFPEISAIYTLIATVTARVSSSVINFILNYKLVFGGSSKRSIVKYYFLWLCQLGASYGLVFLFGNIIGLNLTGAKIVIDLCLAVLSYQIQNRWVFKKSEKNKFYGLLGRFLVWIARKGFKKYRSNVISYDNEGVVYVCRHLNMHGPYTMLKWLDFHAHPMVLSPFFTRKDCYRQYRDYTFTKRQNKKVHKFNFKAYICSRFVPMAVKSIKSVPVYRNSSNALKTFKKSLEYLNKGESIMVFVDKEYTLGADKVSEIYDGFLYLGELYKKRFGKSLKFVPIFIDDKYRLINEYDYITVDRFKEREEAAKYLKEAINNSNPRLSL